MATQKHLAAFEAPSGLVFAAHHQHFGAAFGPNISTHSGADHVAKNFGSPEGQDQPYYLHSDFAESFDRNQGLNLSMDVGGMQLPAAGTSARNSPTSLLANKQEKTSQLTQKLRHLNK